ncbi:Smr/MutS family protein [Maribacter sp. CXY002]|uniref:Smr/MutS family protein n=1 Tax=Maribacter luteocoastalis TaxID=3407671 RepID=UPI003B67814D
MAVFKIGDRVEAIDDIVKGVVIKIDENGITISDEDGFPIRYDQSELVKVENDITVSNYQVAQVKKEKEQPKRRKATLLRPKERSLPKMEVDLHINQLVRNPKGLSNYDMLNLQLETAKHQLEFAISKRLQKVVFIHGVGEGILREELNFLFEKYENIKYYDANYQKYGLGATEVYIFQNQ